MANEPGLPTGVALLLIETFNVAAPDQHGIGTVIDTMYRSRDPDGNDYFWCQPHIVAGKDQQQFSFIVAIPEENAANPTDAFEQLTQSAHREAKNVEARLLAKLRSSRIVIPNFAGGNGNGRIKPH